MTEENNTKIVRHGYFLGKIEPSRIETILKKIKILLEEKLEESKTDTEKYRILQEIKKAITKEGFFSNTHQKDLATDYNFSNQEINWLEKHSENEWLDYMVFRYKFKLYPGQRKINDFPLHLLIELVSFCNLKCVMCFQSDPLFKKEKQGTMSWELLKKVIKEAKENNCGAITIASRGEPTLHPEFGKMLQYVAETGFMEIKINTNGMLLTEKKCHEILKANINEVVFSIDACNKKTYEKLRRGANFEKVVSNVEMFHKIRKEQYPNSITTTRVAGVQVTKEQNLEEMHAFWKDKVDEVMMKKAVERWDTYNNPESTVKTPCKLLWERMYIWFEGTTNPCDFDWQSNLTIGNVKERKIIDIWKGPEYEELRKKHLTGKRNKINPCDKCTLI